MKNIAALAAVAAEGLAVYTFAELLAAAYEPQSRHALDAIIFAVTALIAYGHLRFAASYGLEGASRTVWLAAVPFLVIYGALRIGLAGDIAVWDFGWATSFVSGESVGERGGRAVAGAILLVAIWTRSALRADDEMDIEMIPRAFAVPFAVVTILILAGVPSERSAEVARGGVAFYLVALFSMCASQLALSGATIGGLKIGEITGTLFGATVLAIAAAVVILTLVFAVLAPVIGPPLGEAITFLLTVLLFPIAWVLEKLITLIAHPAGRPNEVLPQLPPEFTAGDLERGAEDSTGLIALKFLFRSLALILLLGLVAAVVSFVARFRRGRAEANEPAARSATGSLSDDATSWLRSLFPGRSRPRPRGRPRQGIRALYDHLLEQSEERGRARGEGTTAREFASALTEVFRSPVTDDITAAFEGAHYGSHEPPDVEVERLRRRLDQTLPLQPSGRD